ncbi:hypothetical protein D3Z48_17720, partial [Clostridiaceae bacterium]|nr:hypothetical protein [Clostridiaceae bacterium]
ATLAPYLSGGSGRAQPLQASGLLPGRTVTALQGAPAAKSIESLADIMAARAQQQAKRQAQQTMLEQLADGGLADFHPLAPENRALLESRVAQEYTPTIGQRLSSAGKSIANRYAGMFPALWELGSQYGKNRESDAADPERARLLQENALLNNRLTAIRQGYGNAAWGSEEEIRAQYKANLARLQGDLRTSTPADPNGFGMRKMSRGGEYQAMATAGMEGVPKRLADTGLSIAGNAPALAANAVLPGVGIVLMGVQAAADKGAELNERGLAPEESLVRGGVSGGIEALTEKYSVESFWKIVQGAGAKTAAKNILRQMGVEASEESASYLLNYIADKAARDPNAEFSLAELANSAAVGALSGGFYGGVGTVVNALGTNGQKNYQYLKERDGGTTPDFDRQYEHYYNQARAGLAEDKIAPYPTQTPLDEPARQNALYAGENDGKAEAAETVNTFLSGGVVGDIALDRALSLPESRAAIEAETGKLPETPSQARKAARDWAAERKQEAQAKPGLVRDGHSASLDARTAERLDRIAKRAGVSVAFSDRLGDAVGEYRDGRITLRAGTENPEMRVLVHELTHHLETSGEYQAFSDSVVEFVEAEKGVPFAELIRQQQDEYAGFGDTLTEDGARRELIANFAQDYLFTDERSIRRLARENRSLVQKIRDWLHDFAVRLRGSAEEKFLLDAEKRYIRALESAEGRQTGETQHTFLGYDEETGRGWYQSNFPEGTPKSHKSEKILNLIQNAWSKQPIPLKITENGETRTILAQFDPAVSDIPGKFTDATKLAGGNKRGSGAERRVAMNLADDYPHIIRDSLHDMTTPEIGKTTDSHKDVKQWHYFVNDILYSEIGSDTKMPYQAVINIKEKDNGDFVYSFAVKRQSETGKKEAPAPDSLSTADRTDASVSPNARTSENSITQPEPDGKGKNSDGQKSQGASFRELERRAEVIEYLRGQMKRTKGLKADAKAVKALAGELAGEYSSGYDKAALSTQLQSLYDTYANRTDTAAFTEMQQAARTLARDVLEQSSVLNDGTAEDYSRLRGYLKETPLAISDADKASVPGGFGEFRKAHRGKIRLTNDGLAVDTAYMELNADFGEALFPADITHPADQLSRMAEVLDSLKPAVENPYARDMGGAVQQLTEEILSASGVQAQSVETWTAGTRDTAQAAEPDGIRDAAPGLFETEVSRNMKTEDREFLHTLFEAVGVRGAIVSQESSVENAHIEDGVITVFANADDAASAYRGTVQHEITHRIKELGAAAYQAYEDFAVAQLAAQNNVQAGSLIEATQAYYKEAAGQELTEAQAREELAGMFAASLDFDTETVRQFVSQSGQNQQTAKGILQTIRDILRSIREKFTGRSLNREQQDFVQQLSEGERLWAEALGEASQLANGNAAQTDGGTRYSIKRAADGSQYVEVEEDIFDGHDDIDFENITSGSLKKIGKVLSGIVETQFSERIDANGQMIGVNKKTAQEWARSKSASRLSRKHPQRFQDKMRAFANADEILQAATDYVGEKPEHPRHDNFTEFSRGTVLLKIGGRGYEAKVIVGITKNGGANLYDVLSLTPTTIEEAPINTTTAAQNATNRRHGTSSENSIADSGENVNYDILYMNQKTDASYSPTVQGAVEDDTSVKESIADPGENINPEKKFSLKNADEAVKKLAQYREQYGALPRGENAVRDILFPQRTTKDTRVRRFSRTAAESATLTDGQADAIGAAVAEGRFNYEPIGDRAARKYAEDMLARGEKAASDAWAQVVARDGRAGKNDIALGEYLLREAAKAGDTGRVVQLAAEIAAEGTRAGQIVQAMRLLKKLDGAGQLVALDATLKKLQGELDRGKSKVFLTVPDELREKLAAAKGETEINAVLDEIYTELAKQIPTTWADKWNAWRYLSMLGNPRTHIRNVLGNAAFEPAILVKNTVGTALEHVFLPRGERTKSLSGLLPRTGGEAMRFAQSDFREMKELITGGGKMNPTDIIRERQRVFKMGWLEWVRKQNFNFLEAEDGVFLEHHYVRAMTQYLKANQIDVKALDADSAEGAKVLNRAREYAVREAQKATYRDFSLTAQVISQASRKTGTAGRVLIEGILPFKKTPINVLKRGVEYSPIGLAKAVTYDANRLRKGKISGSEFIDSLSAGLTGTGIAALGWLLARCGVLVGGGGDDKEQDFRDALGAQSWALKIGDRTFTIDWLAPSSMPLFVGAEAQRLYENGVELNGRSVMDAALSIAEPMTQMSMLDGLNSMLSSVRYGENPLSDLFTGAVTDYVNQAVPTLLGQIARTIDPVRRTTYDDKNSGIPSIAQKTLQTNQNKIPFLSQRSAAYLDIWGREQFSGSLAARALQNFILPGYLRSEKLSDMESELIRLYQATGDGSALPGKAKKSFSVGEGDDRVTKYLTADEYQLFAETRGTLMYSGLSEITSSSYYAALDDVGKLDAVNKMIELSNAVAKTGVSDYELKSWYAKANDGREQYGIRFSDFVLAYAAQSGTESLKDKDGDTITNSGSLRQMQAVYAVPGLSDKQRAYLFEACGVGKSVRHYNRVKVEEELRKMEQKAKK